MKLVPVTYYGFTVMDKRFSSSMLPWIVSEIRKRDYCEKLSLGVEDGILQAYNRDFELQFSHKLWQLTRFSQADQDPTTFLYLLRDDSDSLLFCYLFQAQKTCDVMHVIDRVLDPKLQSTITNPLALDLLTHPTKWTLGPNNKISNFLDRVRLCLKDDRFGQSGGHTFFVPIDHKMDDHRLQTIDGYIVDGHVVPNVVLFTRSAPRDFIFETHANGDYIYIVLALVDSGDKLFVKSHTVLGNSNHKKGEVLAEIVMRDIPVNNGVVHLISQPLAVFARELTPFPYLPVTYKISADPYLNVTSSLMSRPLDNLLKNASSSYSYTFFAPRDKAWADLTHLRPKDLARIVDRHVVVSSTGFSMGELMVLSKSTNGTVLTTVGGLIRIKVVQSEGVFYVVWNGKPIRVYRPDYECSDGLVHVMDGVFAYEDELLNDPDGANGAEEFNFWRMLKKVVTT